MTYALGGGRVGKLANFADKQHIKCWWRVRRCRIAPKICRHMYMLPHGHAGIFVILREIFQFHGNFTNGRGAVSLSCDEHKEAAWHLVIRRLRQLLWSSSDQGYPQSDISKNLGSFPSLLSAHLYNFNSWSFYFILSFTAIRIRTEGGGGRIESGGCWRKGNMRTI